MSEQHTPEPWSQEGVLVRAQDIVTVATCWRGPKESEFNARRIVACVNACRGIETETLESPGTLAEVVVEGRTRYLEEKSLADELAAKLYDCRDYLTEAFNNVLDDARPRYERQRELIRKDLESIQVLLDKYREMRGK